MQEIYAEILEESDNAMWKREWLDEGRLQEAPQELERVVVAIDPAVTSKKQVMKLVLLWLVKIVKVSFMFLMIPVQDTHHQLGVKKQ